MAKSPACLVKVLFCYSPENKIMKVVLCGDSTFARLDKKNITSLEQIVSNNVVIDNYSTGGFNTGDALDQVEVVAKLTVDVYVLCFGLNDAAPWKQVSISVFRSNLEKLIEIFGSKKVMFLIPPLVDENKQDGDKKRTNDALLDYIDVTKQIADANNCLYVDINPALKAATEEIHIEDGLHLTDVGNKIMIKALGDSLAKL